MVKRWPTGVVRGIPEEEATGILVELVGLLGPGAFTRTQARRLLEEKFELDGSKLEGMLFALDRMPGLEKLGNGRAKLPAEPKVWAAHRMWRYAPGRLNLADAQALYTILSEEIAAGKGDLMTPNLERQAHRLERALRSVLPGAVKAGR